MTTYDNTYKPKVSVIIPVYNVKSYVKESLDSVINQTYKNLEIIIVDDGSYDGSEEICNEYAQKDKRIKLIHSKNRGLSAARNIGLDNMSGEYIAFLDSDDVYHPEMIQKMLGAILSSGADCSICKHIILNKNKKINYKKITLNKKSKGKIYTKTEILKATVNWEIECFAWNKLCRKNLFDNVRYPIGKNYEDIYIIFKILDKIKNAFVLDDKLVFYRKRSDSITSTYSLKNIQDLRNAQTNFELYVRNKTPDIFTVDELKNFRNNWLNILIYKYARTIHMDIPEKKELLDWLKKEIREQNSNNEIKTYSLETRIIYYLLFNMPKIFFWGATFYPFVRNFILRNIQKCKLNI